MEKSTKNILIGLGAIATAIVGFGVYQYAQIMRYKIKVKNVLPKKVDATQLNFDVILNFENNSNLQIDILQQNHKVYLNNNFITAIKNDKTNIIMPDSTSPIGFNVDIKFKDLMRILGKEYLNILLHPDTFSLRIDMKFKIKFYGFNINLPYTYELTIKDIMEMAKKKPDA